MLERIKFTPRIWFFVGFVSCISMLGIGAYLQFVEHLEPCPLCISQRIGLLAVGVLMLIAALHNPGRAGIKRYAIAGAVLALIGGSISIRHIWIQHLPPDQVPECGPGLDYVLENFPLAETIKLMLSGTGDCAIVDWTLLGFSIPELTLLAFLGLAGLSLLQIWNIPADNS
jgi:disulfide bond formation protein DsbB